MKRRSQLGMLGCALGAMLPLVAAAPADTGAGLGRLFTTPAERAVIDRLRGVSAPPPGAAAATSDAAPPATGDTRVPASVRLRGVVRRSDGNDEVWLDGGRIGVVGGVNAQDRVPVRIPGTDRRVWLKPGQVLDTATGAVRESYQTGRAVP
jgi:hypothetical protein